MINVVNFYHSRRLGMFKTLFFASLTALASTAAFAAPGDLLCSTTGDATEKVTITLSTVGDTTLVALDIYTMNDGDGEVPLKSVSYSTPVEPAQADSIRTGSEAIQLTLKSQGSIEFGGET